MNKYISNKLLIILFLLEILLLYMVIQSYLTKDLIRPFKLNFYEYLKLKMTI